MKRRYHIGIVLMMLSAMFTLNVYKVPVWAVDKKQQVQNENKKLQEKNKNYMTALKAGGCGHARIIFRHVLRNILPSVIALATMEIGSIILSIAGFSFIGLGVQAPTPEWGIMLSDSRSYIQTYPRLMFYPGILIMIIVLAFNYLGEGIQNGTAQK